MKNPRKEYQIPDHEETLFAIAGDPEASNSSVGILFKMDKEDNTTEAGYREDWIENLFNAMLNQRFRELTQSPQPPFIFATSSKGSFVRTKDFYDLSAMVSPGGFEPALATLLREARRVKKYGFTQSELDRQKQEMLRNMEQAYNERDKTESRVYASEYIRNFLSDEPIPGIEAEIEMVRQFLPGIKLEEVNKLAGEWITDKNRVIMASGPTKDGMTLPTKEQLLTVFDAVQQEDITPYEDAVSDEPLLPEIPEPKSIISQSFDDELGVTRWTLSNNVKVVVKPTDFKNDQVIMSAYSPGGTSLASDANYIPASFATTFIVQSGLGEFGPIEFNKKLSGKVVSVSPTIGTLNEGFRGSAAPQDLETMFQLVYLYFTAPRADSIAYLSYKKRLMDYWQSLQADPETAFRDSIQVVMAQHHFRERVLSPQIFEEMDLQKSLEFFKDRFKDASDFTFYFVGNVDLQQLKTFCEVYLANLPTSNRMENWKDEGIRPPKGVVEKTLHKGIEPKSQVRLYFTGDEEWNLENRRIISALADVLSLRLREVLREDMGGTYGVSARASLSHFPDEEYKITISFGCSPDRVPEMINAVFTQIDSIQNFGASEKDLTKVREKAIRGHEKNLKENRSWLSWLNFHDINGTDPHEIIDGPDTFMKELNSDMIKAAAQKYLKKDNYVKFVLMPEEVEKTQ